MDEGLKLNGETPHIATAKSVDWTALHSTTATSQHKYPSEQVASCIQTNARFVDIGEILSSDPLDDQQLTGLVFDNNHSWAAQFAEKCKEGGRKVFVDPQDSQMFYLVGSSESSGVTTVLKVKRRNLRDNLDIYVENVFLMHKNVSRALDVRSLLPQGKKSPRLSMATETKTAEDDQYVEFAYSPGTNSLLFTEIRNSAGITRLLHECGHVWAHYYNIGPKITPNARKAGYDALVEVERHGLQVVVEEIVQVFASERIANMLGEQLAKQSEIREQFGDLLTAGWKTQQTTRYFNRYVQPLLAKYPTVSAEIEQKVSTILATVVASHRLEKSL